MLDKYLLTKDEVMPTTLTADLKTIYRSLQKWIEMSDEKVAKFVTKFHMSQKLYGKALKTLFKQLEDKPNSLAVDQQILNVNIISMLISLFSILKLILLFFKDS